MNKQITLNKNQTILTAYTIEKNNTYKGAREKLSFEQLNQLIELYLNDKDLRSKLFFDICKLENKVIKTKTGNIILSNTEIKETIKSLSDLWNLNIKGTK